MVNTSVNIGETIGLEARLANLVVVVAEELLLSLEELVGLFVIDQPQLVRVLRQRLDQAAELLFRILGAHVQVFGVLEEYAQVRVVLEHRMVGQTTQKHFVNLHRFLEYRQVLAFKKNKTSRFQHTQIMMNFDLLNYRRLKEQ